MCNIVLQNELDNLAKLLESGLTRKNVALGVDASFDLSRSNNMKHNIVHIPKESGKRSQFLVAKREDGCENGTRENEIDPFSTHSSPTGIEKIRSHQNEFQIYNRSKRNDRISRPSSADATMMSRGERDCQTTPKYVRWKKKSAKSEVKFLDVKVSGCTIDRGVQKNNWNQKNKSVFANLLSAEMEKAFNELQIMTARNVELQKKIFTLEKEIKLALELNQELDKRENELNQTLESVNSELNETKLKLNEVNCEFEIKYTDLKQEVKCAKETYEKSMQILKTKYESVQIEKCKTIKNLEKVLHESKIQNSNSTISQCVCASRPLETGGQHSLTENLIQNLNFKDDSTAEIELSKKPSRDSEQHGNLNTSEECNTFRMSVGPCGDFQNEFDCRGNNNKKEQSMACKEASFPYLLKYVDSRLEAVVGVIKNENANIEHKAVEAFQKTIFKLAEESLLRQAKALKEAEELKLERENLLLQLEEKNKELDIAVVAETEARRERIKINERFQHNLELLESSHEMKLASLQHQYCTQLDVYRNQFEEQRMSESRRHHEEVQDLSKRFEVRLRESEEKTRKQLEDSAKEIDTHRLKVNMVEAEREKQLQELQLRLDELRATHEDVLRRLTIHHKDSVKRLRYSLWRERERNQSHGDEIRSKINLSTDFEQKCSKLADLQAGELVNTGNRVDFLSMIDTLKMQVQILQERAAASEEDNRILRRKFDAMSEVDQKSQSLDQMMYRKSYAFSHNLNFSRNELSNNSHAILSSGEQNQSLHLVDVLDKNNPSIIKNVSKRTREVKTKCVDSPSFSLKS